MLLDMQERLLRTEAVLGMAPSVSVIQLVDPDADDVDSESDSASESSKTAAPTGNEIAQQHAVSQLRLLSAVGSPQEAQLMSSPNTHQQNAAVKQEEDEVTTGLNSHHLQLDMTSSASVEEVQLGTCESEDQTIFPSTSQTELSHLRSNAQTDGATTLLAEHSEASSSRQHLQFRTPSPTQQGSTATNQDEEQEQLVAEVDGFSQQRDESKDQPAQLLPAIVQPASPLRSAANAATIKKPKGRFKGFFRFRPANNRFL